MIAIGIKRVRRGERQVHVGRVVIDDVADHLRVGHQVGRDVVAQRQREGEDRARDERREHQRHHHPPEGRQAARAKVGRRFEQRVRNALEAGVDGQDHVRQPQVAEHQPRVADLGQARTGHAERRERPVDQAVALQDDPPRVDLDQVRGPQRNEHGDDEQATLARRRDARHVVRDRNRQQRVGDRHQDRRCRPCAPR